MKIDLTKKEIDYLKEIVRYDYTIRVENLEGSAMAEYSETDGEEQKKEDAKFSKLAKSVLQKIGVTV